MKRGLGSLCLLVLISTGVTVIMEPTEEPILTNEDPATFNEAFSSCLSRKEFGTLECVNRGALSTLQSLNHKDDLDFGDVHLERADGYGRELLDWDYDPKDFGNIVTAATRLMERRSLKWSLDSLYPGLQLRAGPMLNGNGVLEFVLNERATTFGDRQTGTGRQMMRHLLLPFLLGFKFNLASLIPLLFGFLLIITKKALLLTKIALFVSGLLGWNSLFSSAAAPYPGAGFNGFPAYLQEAPGGGFPYHDHQNYQHRPYGGYRITDLNPYSQHVIREVVDVYDNAEEMKNKRSGKNFVWVKGS
ncbi:uncharacterized protein LOC128874914 [Hylaeus volcanicus]|uniref:uncharacterized protein LOC128874914 n=1 Tax=Hylaeus volcanicus TaxID=313075 RepID=UPI0023B81A1D|nr:uncharacterized protein LOC128874914 [Hylaeus volcanicus]